MTKTTEAVAEETLDSLDEMSGSVAVKGPFLRELTAEIRASRQQIGELLSLVAELQQDAGRYRWLRDQAQFTWSRPPMRAVTISWRIFGTCDLAEVDAAIDAALKQGGGL